jgi:multidrug efflux pump
MAETTDKKDKGHKGFGLTTAAVGNRKTVFLITFLIIIWGVSAFMTMPKENFPELTIPEIYVNTPYPGGTPDYVEEKITDPFETEIAKIKNIDKLETTTIEGFSIVKVTFDFSVTPDEGKRKVEDAIKDARATPGFIDLPVEPRVQKVDFGDIPIMNINLSGDYSVDSLKTLAEDLKDQIKALPEISDVDIRGVQEKDLKIELRKNDAEARGVSYGDIFGAIQNENVRVPGGEIFIGGTKHSVKIDAELKTPEEIADIIVKQEDGEDEIFLKDVANVSFGDEDTTSYAREFGRPVVMLDIKKASGENLLMAADKIREMLLDQKKLGIPEDVTITVTNDQSVMTREQVSNLMNSIIFGVILVVGVLLFFLGLRNAAFVGVAIPLSMFMSFMILNSFGITLNVMVLFSMVLALGMLVDNGIVVVENIYRLMDEEGLNSFDAARKGVGEVAWPIIASTATTLAAFAPLAMWPGMMGEFMKYLPITLMIVLGSSLFVALVINPVLTAVWMKVGEQNVNKKRWLVIGIVAIIVGVLLDMVSFAMGASYTFGNLILSVGVIILLNQYLLTPGSKRFQSNVLPRIENFYQRFLARALRKKNPRWILGGTIGMLLMSFVLMGVFPPNVLFFPENEPNYVNVFVEYPIGTDIKTTNAAAIKVENILNETVVKKYENSYNIARKRDENGKVHRDTVPIIESIITQVGNGTSDPAQGPVFGNTPHKARITVSFAEFQHRKGIETSDILSEIREELKGKFPADVKINAAKNEAGPPQPPAINIEVKGPGVYSEKIKVAEQIRVYLRDQEVKGVEGLKLDVQVGRPELVLKIDRNKARLYGMSTGQVASTIQTTLLGTDISTFDKGGDTYDINVRMAKEDRSSVESVLDQKIVFRNNTGKWIVVPIRSVLEDYKQITTYGSVVRKEQEQLVTIFSGVNEGANADKIVTELKKHVENFMKDNPQIEQAGYTVNFTGQQEEMAKEMAFLSKALGIAVFLILLIIVSQFNSFSTPVIILASVVFSLIGVLLGLMATGMDFVVIMTMLGIISLAGVVVNNAIVLIDYTNLIRKRKRAELKLTEDELLPMEEVVSAVVEGGKTRLRPVLLTAITTILGLLPLATGLNINFFTLYSEFNPQIFVGGDNVMFFGPMSWTILFGLTFATFLTLVFVPVLYLLLYRLKLSIYKGLGMKMKSNI